MKVLIINGSPRKNGHTEKLTNEVIRGIKTTSKEAKIEQIKATEKNISPCTACGVCEGESYCIIKDDMQEVYQKIEACDVIIIASPLYFCTVTAQIKPLIDRAQMYFNNRVFRNNPIIKEDNKRKGILVSTGGSEYPNQFSCIETTISYFFDEINAEIQRPVVATKTDTVPIKEQEKALKIAFSVGEEVGRRK